MRPTPDITTAAYGNARREHRRLQATHVAVGDHDPEPRCDVYRDKITGLLCRDDANGYTRTVEGWAAARGAHYLYRNVLGEPTREPTRKQGGYGASFDD